MESAATVSVQRAKRNRQPGKERGLKPDDEAPGEQRSARQPRSARPAWGGGGAMGLWRCHGEVAVPWGGGGAVGLWQGCGEVAVP